ncbi:TPA: relaxase, partial [Streptococcus suis]|nr:relaxase [Streptococcus suis]
PTMTSLKEKIAELNLFIELDLNNQSYQEVKDELINEIAQLDLTITDLQDKVAHLNKVAEVLLNLNTSDPENRRLARYDYAKMNLTPAIKLEEVEKDIEAYQKQMNEYIDEYEHQVRRLEKLVNTINFAIDSEERSFNVLLD